MRRLVLGAALLAATVLGAAAPAAQAQTTYPYGAPYGGYYGGYTGPYGYGSQQGYGGYGGYGYGAPGYAASPAYGGYPYNGGVSTVGTGTSQWWCIPPGQSVPVAVGQTQPAGY